MWREMLGMLLSCLVSFPSSLGSRLSCEYRAPPQGPLLGRSYPLSSATSGILEIESQEEDTRIKTDSWQQAEKWGSKSIAATKWDEYGSHVAIGQP
ncbi:hypothetical protein BJX70DRAFT_78608 [Aspergillus crustosus]